MWNIIRPTLTWCKAQWWECSHWPWRSRSRSKRPRCREALGSWCCSPLPAEDFCRSRIPSSRDDLYYSEKNSSIFHLGFTKKFWKNSQKNFTKKFKEIVFSFFASRTFFETKFFIHFLLRKNLISNLSPLMKIWGVSEVLKKARKLPTLKMTCYSQLTEILSMKYSLYKA